MVDRIKAAVDGNTDPDFIVMARTDALAVEGLDRAIERALACVEAGADAVFPQAMTELSMYRKFAEAGKGPGLPKITQFRPTPPFNPPHLPFAPVPTPPFPLSPFPAPNPPAPHV